MVNCLYIVEVTEYERGWGSRPEGFLCFPDEVKAMDYIKEETKDRVGHAPDIYWSYRPVGYLPASEKMQKKLKQKNSNGRIWVDNLTDLN